MRKQMGIPPRFYTATFASFQKEVQPSGYDFAKRFVDQYRAGSKQGLYLFGIPGSGKTHLAAAIGNAVLSARFMTAPELLLSIKKTFKDDGADDSLLDSLSQTKLLILDDLGSEKPTEWVKETLFILIDRRYTHNLPTVITSNYSLDELKMRLGYRIASRIAEVCEMVELRPNDYRIKGKQP